MKKQDLEGLEERSIYIMKEANGKFKNIAILWNTGGYSTTMIALARKAFLGKVPFPIVFIDNGIEFPETYDFRERLAEKWNLKLIVAHADIKPESCCGSNKTAALRKIIKQNGFDALIVSKRMHEDEVGTEEGHAGPGENLKRDYKEQSAELWREYASGKENGYVTIHPMLDWSEVDLWNYMKREKIPVNPLYFSKKEYRYRSLGCTRCALKLKSDAKGIDAVIKELEATRTGEGGGSERDKEKEYIMEKLKSLGYL